MVPRLNVLIEKIIIGERELRRRWESGET